MNTNQINALINRAVQFLDGVLSSFLGVSSNTFEKYLKTLFSFFIVRDKFSTTWADMPCIIFSN